MGKTIGLKQLAGKKYQLVQGLPEVITASIGNIEDSFDAIIYGPSGNGKTNFTVSLLKQLIIATNAKCEYVAYEEGHGKTVQDTMIMRHNMLEAVGNKLQITDHLSFEELDKKMAKKQSAKIWVIDSIQASGLTYRNYQVLKKKYLMSRKRKIIIFISWNEGKEPKGADAKSIKYDCNIKMEVDRFIMFAASRFGGNKPYVIWEEGAKRRWGKDFYRVAEIPKPARVKKSKTEPETELPVATAPIVHMQILPPATDQEKAEMLFKNESKTN